MYHSMVGHLFSHLFTVSELLSSDYTETFYKEDGTRVTAAPNHIVSVL